MQTMASETVNNVDKVKRYGWIIQDSPGELRMLHKNILQIHPAYQRDLIPAKVKDITGRWSWVGCGAIVVGERGGDFWVIDGQHRVLSAKRRSDITHLPCIVFQTDGIRQEAEAFLVLNTGRKPVSSIGKFKAMIAAGDPAACLVNKTLEELGVSPRKTATKGREIKSLAWAVKRAQEDAKKFELIMRVASELCTDMPIREIILEGLWYINERISGGIEEKRFAERLRFVGAKRLVVAAQKASAYFVRGGANTWAIGMMDEINKGLRKRFELDEK